jgi:segregation and condensation protein B
MISRDKSSSVGIPENNGHPVEAVDPVAAATDPAHSRESFMISFAEQQLPLLSALETILFVSDGSVETAQLAKLFNLSSEEIYKALKQLNEQYAERVSGLRIQEHNGRFQLVTHPQFAHLIEAYLNLDLTTKLSAPALETLAIVAYRQPVTRAQIEAVRGVDCSGILRSLLQRNLIEEAGRLDGVGRPILYSVTEEFMHHFGLTGLDELPQLETTEADTLWAATKLAELTNTEFPQEESASLICGE